MYIPSAGLFHAGTWSFSFLYAGAGADGQLESLLSKNHYLNTTAKEGYRSYLQAYASYSLKKIFDVNSLDLAKVGKAFGFAVPPKVNISVGGVKGKKEKAGSDSEDEGQVKRAYYRKRVKN